LRITVIDGQGGGIGKAITEKLRKNLPKEVEIIALGTNALATALMLKAGANDGASGENAVVQSVVETDVIVGSLAIIVPHAMMGELTPVMAEAIAKSKAPKILLPLNRCGIDVVGVYAEPLPHLIDHILKKIKDLMEK